MVKPYVMRALSTFIILLMATNFCFGQKLTEENIDADIVKMQKLMVYYIDSKDRYYHPKRKDEVMLMLIETDSNGVVFNLHLLADKNNRDSTCAIVEKMKPEDFGYYKFESLKNKVINMPIYSVAYNGPRFVVKSTIHYDSKNFTTNRGGVLSRPLYYPIPGEPMYCPQPVGSVVVPTVVNK